MGHGHVGDLLDGDYFPHLRHVRAESFSANEKYEDLSFVGAGFQEDVRVNAGINSARVPKNWPFKLPPESGLVQRGGKEPFGGSLAAPRPRRATIGKSSARVLPVNLA